MAEPAHGGGERTIAVAEIAPSVRHTVICQLFEHLAPDQSLQLVVDHDPGRLRFQLEARYGARCIFTVVEAGPDVWRIRLRRAAATRPGAAS